MPQESTENARRWLMSAARKYATLKRDGSYHDTNGHRVRVHHSQRAELEKHALRELGEAAVFLDRALGDVNISTLQALERRVAALEAAGRPPDVPQPCRADYRDSNGHGPHECSLPAGHAGPHR